MAAKRENGRFVSRQAGTTEPTATSAGFGESKIFAAPEGSFEDKAIDWTKLTLGGHPIPEHQYGLIPYAITDQGKAEREKEIEANGGRAHSEFPQRKVTLPGGIGVNGNLKESTEMYVDQTRAGARIAEQVDMAKAGRMPWEFEGRDAMSETMEAYIGPGERGRYISPRVADKMGMRGWEPVKEANGDPVKVDNMILCKMPEKSALQRQEFFRGKAREQMVLNEEIVREQSEQITSAAKVKRLTRGDRGEDEGYVSVRGDERDFNDRDFATA